MCDQCCKLNEPQDFDDIKEVKEIDGPRGITMEEAHEIAIKNMQ